jgi:hypothetical protein
VRWWERLWAGRVGPLRSSDGSAALLPLTPQFQAGQHEDYVVRLTAALQDPDVRNIALTGRYGAGKSSALKAFTEQHPERTLNLSLSTLGPSEDGPSEEKTSITNRIEKELVKQLLHSQPQRALPRSHFRRIDKPDFRRAVAFATTQVVVVALILFLLGRFPRLAGATKDHPWPVRAGAVLLFGLLMVAVLTWIRQVVHNQVVSSVSAAGATVALGAKEVGYFDKYLDEIVYFFESTKFDVVVFEDLDRFDDPHIFEALRELNTLLNTSHAARGRTIRFVYALKDSIFERLGNDTMQLHDGASAESVRANRTKFFDLVVPVVPFITHRTSRDLLTTLLADPALVPVTSDLVDLVARHLSDMRLLKNIRNEYAVFAARLITAKHGVPQLRADSVFAMMVYKNVHLADFEQISLGRSDLDKLYKLSRDLVNQSITRRRDRLSNIADSEALAHVLREEPERFGQHLNWYANVIRSSSNYHQYNLTSYTIGAQTFSPAQAGTAPFWRALIADGNRLTASFGSYNWHIPVADIRELFRAELNLDDWDSRERQALDAERAELNAEITALRKADFADLAANPAFNLARDSAEATFEKLLGETICSEVARDLIRRGFIDQNFALYVAQYYGERVSIRAMNFIVQHVQPNIPDTYYSFDGPDDIVGVLRETKADFLDLDSAYNIEILDHLLASQHPGARTVLDRLTEIDGLAERAFLQAYLSGGAQAAEAVRRLSGTWPPILSRILEVPDLQPERRLDLVDEGLAHADPNLDRQIEEKVTTYLQDNYARLGCLTRPADQQPARNAVALLRQARVVIDDLTVLENGVRALVVADSMYPLTAGNLRSALHDPPALSLDTVRVIDPTVYGYCVANPADYLAAVENDGPTTVTVADPGTFANIVTEIAGWDTGLAERACRAAAAECRIVRLAEVPREVWPALARSRRFPATVTNTAAYIEQADGVDNDLAGLLADAGAITDPPGEPDRLAEQRTQVAVTILRSRESIPAPETRAALVATLTLTESIAAKSVEPEDGPLLGELLRHQICDDTAELFQRFATGDWETLRHGIECSTKFSDFIMPALLDEDMTARLLGSTSISQTIREAVLSRLDEFVPTDHRDALRAAGRFAATAQVQLSPTQLERITRVTRDPELAVLLIDQLGSVISTDQIMTALANLGSPYTDLATPTASPTFPDDTHHLRVLTRLKQEGRLLNLSRRRTKSQISVTVA